ncbi:MAG: DMT family transporter [Pseudomonadota bacterium]
MDTRAIIAGLAFALIWSSAFSSARIIVAEAPPMLALSLRFFLSGALGVGIALILGQSWRLSREQWGATIVFGLCQNALYLGLNFIAMQTVQASLASIIASSLPLLAAVVGGVVYHDRLSPLGIVGLLGGAIGVCLIMGLRLQGGADPMGIALCVIGVICLTIATYMVRGALAGKNLLMIVGLQMWVGALALLGPGVIFETWDVVWTPRLTLAFIYTSLFPGLIATVIWFWLVGRIGAVKAATYHFLNPFFGVSIAALILGERMGLLDIVGVVIITLGIWAVQTARKAAR